MTSTETSILGIIATFKDAASAGLEKLDSTYRNVTGRMKGDGGKSFHAMQKAADDFTKKADKAALTGAAAFATTGYAMHQVLKPALELDTAMTKLDMYAGLARGSEGAKKAKADLLDFAQNSVSSLESVGGAFASFLKTGYSYDRTKMLTAAADKFSQISMGEIDIAKSSDFMVSVIAKAGIDLDKFGTDGKKTVTELSYAFDMLAKGADIAKTDIKDYPQIFNSMRQALAEQGATMKDPKKFAGVITQIGIAQNLGMQPAEAGHLISSYSASMAALGRSMTLDKIGGGKARGGQGRNILAKVFGTNDEIRKWMVDAQGNFRDAGDMMVELNQRMDKMNLNNVERQGALGMVFNMLSKQLPQNMRNLKVEASQVLYEVDSLGRKTNRVMFDPKLHKSFNEKTKTAILEGAEAYVYLRGEIQNAIGYQDTLLQKYQQSADYAKKAAESSWEVARARVGETLLKDYTSVMNTIGGLLNKFLDLQKTSPVLAGIIGFGLKIAFVFSGLLLLLGTVGSVMGRGFSAISGILGGLQGKISGVAGSEKTLQASSIATTAALTRQNAMMNTKAGTAGRLSYSLKGATMAENSLARASTSGMTSTGGFNPGVGTFTKGYGRVGLGGGRLSTMGRLWQGGKGLLSGGAGLLKGGGLVGAAFSFAPMIASSMSSMPTAQGLTAEQTAEGATDTNIALLAAKKKQDMINSFMAHGMTKADAEAAIAKRSAESFAIAAKNDIEAANQQWTLAKGLASEASSTASTVGAIIGGILGLFFGPAGALAGAGIGSSIGRFIGALAPETTTVPLGTPVRFKGDPDSSSIRSGNVQAYTDYLSKMPAANNNKVNINLTVPEPDKARIAQEVRARIKHDIQSGEFKLTINNQPAVQEQRNQRTSNMFVTGSDDPRMRILRSGN